MYSHNRFSMKTGFVYLLFLTISISTTFCVRHKPLYSEEGIKQVNGIDIYYKIIGEGLPLVFVHGGPGLEHTYFLPHMNELAKDYQLIYFDQRCSGRSGGNVDSALITINQFVEDIEGLRKALNLSNMNLVGHSFGGLLAQYYAIQYSENLNSLVLMNTAGANSEFLTGPGNPKCQMTDEDRQALNALISSFDPNNLTPELWEEFFRLQFRKNFYNKTLLDSLDLSFMESTAQNVPYVNSLMLGNLGEFDIHQDLSNIICPTLIIHSEYEPVRLELIDQIKENIKDSRLEVIDQCGHFPFIEAREQLSETLNSFYNNL